MDKLHDKFIKIILLCTCSKYHLLHKLTDIAYEENLRETILLFKKKHKHSPENVSGVSP